MIITRETATYVKYAIMAIDLGKVEIPLTNRCPECGETIDTYLSAASDDPHLVYQNTSDTFVILIGCEGYWVVNPELIGLPRGEWQDWTDNPLGDEATGVGSDDAVCVLNPEPNSGFNPRPMAERNGFA